MMKRFLAAIAALLIFHTAALADFAFTPGVGLAGFSFTGSTGGTSLCAAANTNCFASVPINTAGAQLFTSGNPGVVSQATAANLNATVVGTGTFVVQANPGTAANWGVGATGSAVPANAVFAALSDGTNLRGWLQAANALNSTGTGIGSAQIVGQFDDVTPISITENQFGNIRMSANRNIYDTIRDAAGNERGANVDASNRLTTAPTMVSGSIASGAFASGSVASGAYASGSFASGAYASGSIGSGAMVDLGAIADAAATAGSTGTLSAKLRLMTTQLGTINTTLGSPFQAGGSIGNTTFAATQATAANLNATVVGTGTFAVQANPGTAANWGVGATGAAVPANAVYGGFNVGGNLTGVSSSNPLPVTAATLDPCQSVVKTNVPVNITTSTQVLAGTSAKKNYICSVNIVPSAGFNISVVTGTGTICATSPTALIGATTVDSTHGSPLAANGGYTYGSGIAWIAGGGANADNLCVLVSGTGFASGNMTVVQN